MRLKLSILDSGSRCIDYAVRLCDPEFDCCHALLHTNTVPALFKFTIHQSSTSGPEGNTGRDWIFSLQASLSIRVLPLPSHVRLSLQIRIERSADSRLPVRYDMLIEVFSRDRKQVMLSRRHRVLTLPAWEFDLQAKITSAFKPQL